MDIPFISILLVSIRFSPHPKLTTDAAGRGLLFGLRSGPYETTGADRRADIEDGKVNSDSKPLGGSSH